MLVAGQFQYRADAQDPAMTAAQGLESSVAMIRASDCGRADSVGTGFVWRDQRTVITARHVVAGCDHVSVVFTSTGHSYRAIPDQELPLQDLAALKLDGAAPARPLSIHGGLPPVGSRVVALGYPDGAPTQDSKELQVTVANSGQGSSVEDMLDDRLRDGLIRSGEIDVRTLVLRLDGNLVPGLSGAPLIAADGGVYAVGSGGIAEGAGGVVWAVRAQYLQQFASAPHVTRIAAQRQASGLSFSYQTEQTHVSSVSCESLHFRRSRSAPLTELTGGTDDPLGLQQLEFTFGTIATDLSTVSFDIWVNDESGAAIAVPAGATLTPDTNGCTAHIGPGVDLFITVDRVSSAMDIQSASVSFEQQLASHFSNPLAPDFSYSYPSPRARADGFIIRRAAYGANIPLPQAGMAVRADYAFVAHMSRGQTYIGIGGTRQNTIVDVQKAQACQMKPGDADCAAMRRAFVPWAKAALAIQLSTIPPI
jgi:hypothetical protein